MCRCEAVNAVTEQMPTIVNSLLFLTDDIYAKKYDDSTGLVDAICQFGFVFALMILKEILSNTSVLSRYLQGKNADIINTK